MNTAIGVMARAPSSPGKTRLAPHLSPSRLIALRAALLSDTLRLLESVSAVTVFFTPDEAEPEIASFCAGTMKRIPQGKGDLGARMRAALERLLDRRRHEAALLVGSDIPLIGADQLRDALDTLQANGGVVLGPADDGGYYLIGMTQVYPELFERIAWGSDSVLTDTLRAAERSGVDARLVDGAYDIDTIADLDRLERDLAVAGPTIAPHVRSWLKDR